MNQKKPLKTKLATDSPGCTQALMMTHFHFFKGYFLLGSAVIVIIGVGRPRTESHIFPHS